MTYLKTNLQQKQSELNPNQTGHSLVDVIVDSIFDIKAKRVVRIDLTDLPESVCDHFIICEGTSTTQVKAIADNVMFEVKKATGELPLSSEGKDSAEWVLVDFVDVVVHVFLKETRAFYQLEELWADAKMLVYDDEGNLIEQ